MAHGAQRGGRSKSAGSRWTDWRTLYAVGLTAATLLGGFTAGWRHAPTAFLLALLGLMAAHGGLLGLGAATEGSRRWLRCSWGLCALLVLGIPSEHPDAPVLAMFVPLGSMLTWLVVFAGWLVFVCRLALYALQRSAPHEWTSGGETVPREALRATLLLCVALLLLHLWPGLVHGVLAFPTYALTLGSLALTWAWVGLEPLLAGRFHAAEPVRRATSRPNARLVVAGASLVVATTILLWYGTLRRGAFSFWRERFEALARTAVVTTDAVGPTGKGEWIGPWYVDAIAADARGGVYLRTWRGFDFIDVLSYGFAYRPNLKGSPFGAAKYWLHRISGDWWIFRASSDWF